MAALPHARITAAGAVKVALVITPRPADGTLIVQLDESPDRRGMWEFENRRDMLIGALRYLYATPTLSAAYCLPGGETFG